jgi:predicted RNase H-like nuclease (RuvC/YqgF family)
MRRSLSLVVFLIAVSAWSPLFAQSKADEKELASYALTLPTLQKVVATMRGMTQEMMSDPRYQKLMQFEQQIEQLENQLKPLEEKDDITDAESAKMDSLNEQIEKLREQREQAEEAMAASTNAPNMNDAKSLDDMERGIAGFAPMARALKREGLSPREFAKFTMAMLQAGMIYGFSQGKVDYAKLLAGVNPENIKFIAAHKAELDAMQQEFAAMGKRRR